MIVIEDKKQCLKDYIQVGKMKMGDFLEIAIAITQETAKLHSKNIIHQDLNPANIILNIDSKKVIIKKSILSIQATDTIIVHNGENIDGNLRYISPEQTGIVSQAIDFRSDLYSLGVVFYEMLSGNPPFISNDPLELIHAHIAVKATSLHEMDVEIPEVISNIVHKLLAKSANERYQSVFGLVTDFASCLSEFKEHGQINCFHPGANDSPTVFKIPEKHYGRAEELTLLKELFGKVKSRKSPILFITGAPGIGKTHLINELREHFSREGAAFISGKFDQYKSDIPYSAIIEAFRDLIRQLLSKKEKELSLWKKKIITALGINGQLVTDVIPELELIIGKQKPLEELSAEEAKNRFHSVFQNFIKLFANEAYPLLLFLDDLHWSDTGSLELLDAVFSRTTMKSIMLIGAFRDIEAENNLSLTTLINNFQKNKPNYQLLNLKPVNKDFVADLLKEALAQDIDMNDPFVHLILEKSYGNPMFIKEFLIDLYKKGLIRHQLNEANHVTNQSNCWHIELDKIRHTSLAANVVEIISERLQKLPYHTVTILKLGSCIGIEFSLDILSKIQSKPVNELLEYLEKAISEGIIQKKAGCFQFIHDKIREAVYNIISPKAKEKNHYFIGKLLLKQAGQEKNSEEIFSIVHQLNPGKNLVNVEERKILVDLNLRAGYYAIKSTAYHAAVHFLKQGIDLLAKDSWKGDYETTLSFYTSLLEAEYSTRNHEAVDAISSLLFLNAKSLSVRIRAYELKIDCYTDQMKYTEVFTTARAALKELNFILPEKIGNLTILKEKVKISYQLKNGDIAGLTDLPTITDPNMKILIKLMAKISDAAYTTNPYLFGFLILKGVQLSLKHGNCPGTAYFYSGLAVLYCQQGFFNDIDKGYNLSKIALDLTNKYYSKSLHIKILFANTYITHWKESIKSNLNNYLKVIDLCLNDSDKQYFRFSYLYYTTSYLLMGKTLNKSLDLFNQYTDHINKLEPFDLNSYFLFVKQALDDPSKSQDKLFLNSFYLTKCFMFYLYDDYKKGVELCKNEKIFLDGLCSSPTVPIYYFFYALHLTGNYLNVNKILERIKYDYQLRRIQKKFKNWGRHNQSTYLAMYFLIAAEISRIKNKDSQAGKLYKKSIELAKENQFQYCQAIACECAANFYFAREMLDEGRHYLKAAYHCYEQWGAKGKLKKLLRQYPDLNIVTQVNHDKVKDSGHDTRAKSVSHTCSVADLNLQAITEASNLFSVENDVNTILKKLISIVRKKSGADRVLLNYEKFFLEASSFIDKETTINTHDSAFQEQHIPLSIIRFVTRSKETVLIPNVSKEKRFSTDQYILDKKPKSILCMPVVFQNKLLGIIYLENSQVSDLFAFSRHLVLKNLVNQIALIIENSLLNKKQLSNHKKTKLESELILNKILKSNYKLTNQEIKIALLFKEGYNREEICVKLNISYNTLRSYLKWIYEKTINPENEVFEKVGRVDKLSTFILFLNKLESYY